MYERTCCFKQGKFQAIYQETDFCECYISETIWARSLKQNSMPLYMKGHTVWLKIYRKIVNIMRHKKEISISVYAGVGVVSFRLTKISSTSWFNFRNFIETKMRNVCLSHISFPIFHDNNCFHCVSKYCSNASIMSFNKVKLVSKHTKYVDIIFMIS